MATVTATSLGSTFAAPEKFMLGSRDPSIETTTAYVNGFMSLQRVDRSDLG